MGEHYSTQYSTEFLFDYVVILLRPTFLNSLVSQDKIFTCFTAWIHLAPNVAYFLEDSSEQNTWQAPRTRSFRDHHCHHLLACPACLCSFQMVQVLVVFLKVHAVPPETAPSPASDGRGSFLRFSGSYKFGKCLGTQS